MSHIVTIKTQCKDREAIRKACSRLSLAPPAEGTATIFGTSKTGTIVKLPGWNYPIVIARETGEIHFDNYGGSWGHRRHLDAFRQAYAVEKAKAEATRKGHRVTEKTTADGKIELEITVK
jgi:hypothetical protein